MTDPSVAPWAPADRAAGWTRSLLWFGLSLSAVGAFSGLLEMELLSRLATEGVSEAEAAGNDARQLLIGRLQLGTYLATVVAFVLWFRRAHANLPALGCRELKYSPAWAAWGFFIPFLNLFRPFQVMREVWHGSDPDGVERDRAPDGASVRNRLGAPALVGGWWTLFLVAGFIGNAALRMSLGIDEASSLGDFQTLNGIQILADLVDIPLTLLALALVGRVTAAQSVRRDLVLRAERETEERPGAGVAQGA